jgi:actin-related protein
MSRPRSWMVACVAAGSVLATAAAQAPRGGGAASAQLMEQMQQLASERTTLQAENEKLKGQLADLKKDRDALKAGQQAIERRAQGAAAELAQSTSQREATEQQLAQYKAKMDELIGKFRETIQKLRETEAEDTTAKQSLAARERELHACVDHNLSLYQLNDEVLTHFDRQGFWSRFARSEPFTQIKRVRNENLIDDYRSRAQDQLTPGAKPTPNNGASVPREGAPPTAPPDGANSGH